MKYLISNRESLVKVQRCTATVKVASPLSACAHFKSGCLLELLIAKLNLYLRVTDHESLEKSLH